MFVAHVPVPVPVIESLKSLHTPTRDDPTGGNRYGGVDCTTSGVLLLTDSVECSIWSFDPRTLYVLAGTSDTGSGRADGGSGFAKGEKLSAPTHITLCDGDRAAYVLDRWQLRYVTLPELDPSMFHLPGISTGIDGDGDADSE